MNLLDKYSGPHEDEDYDSLGNKIRDYDHEKSTVRYQAHPTVDKKYNPTNGSNFSQQRQHMGTNQRDYDYSHSKKATYEKVYPVGSSGSVANIDKKCRVNLDLRMQPVPKTLKLSQDFKHPLDIPDELKVLFKNLTEYFHVNEYNHGLFGDIDSVSPHTMEKFVHFNWNGTLDEISKNCVTELSMGCFYYHAIRVLLYSTREKIKNLVERGNLSHEDLKESIHELCETTEREGKKKIERLNIVVGESKVVYMNSDAPFPVGCTITGVMTNMIAKFPCSVFIPPRSSIQNCSEMVLNKKFNIGAVIEEDHMLHNKTRCLKPLTTQLKFKKNKISLKNVSKEDKETLRRMFERRLGTNGGLRDDFLNRTFEVDRSLVVDAIEELKDRKKHCRVHKRICAKITPISNGKQCETNMWQESGTSKSSNEMYYNPKVLDNKYNICLCIKMNFGLIV